jgi:DNA invertase Pin-like site-specific DNA recombinase
VPRHSTNDHVPIAHPYARISHPEQRKGGGLERQTTANLQEFCARFGFTLSKRLWVDDGVSAFRGLNASPEHQLGQFLAEARKGLIRPGDCLLLENYDRMSRQDPWASIGLINELRQFGIHVGRMDRMKLLRADSNDAGDFFEAAVELMRGNSESAMKSMRNGAAWQRKRKAARESGAILTHRLPAWIEERGGKLVLIPRRAALVKRIFGLSASGYGLPSIVKRLAAESVPAWSERKQRKDGRELGGVWTRTYIARILTDRRALGELQPRTTDEQPDGPPIPNYYPAVVTDHEFHAAAAGMAQRRKTPGRHGSKLINVFAGLLRHARDGDSYYLATRINRPKGSRKDGSPRSGSSTRVLLNSLQTEGLSRCYSFPFDCFERALLGALREIDPAEVLGQESSPDEVLVLSGEMARLESSITLLEADLEKHGDSPALFKRLRAQEAKKGALSAKLAAARQQAASPLSEAWGQYRSLVDALDSAPDPQDARLRLRAAIRRIVSGIWCLFVPRGHTRLAAVQVWFAGDGHRDYFIVYRPPAGGAVRTRPARWGVRSLAEVAATGNLDLRRRKDARLLEEALAAVELPSDLDRE